MFPEKTARVTKYEAPRARESLPLMREFVSRLVENFEKSIMFDIKIFCMLKFPILH